MYQSPITLEALLVLDAIDRRGSFAAAAEQLGKVPSALSYIVQKLEEQLGVTLFVRQGRRSILTPAGRHLLTEGRKVLGAVSKIAEQTQTLAHGFEPKIRIAYDSILDTGPLYQVLKQSLSEHADVEIDLREEVMNGGWEALIDDQVELLLGAPGPVPSQQGLRAIQLISIKIVLVVAKNHELTQFDRPVTQADLKRFRSIIVHDSAKLAVPRSSNIIAQSKHFYVTRVSEKIKAIKAGLGIGFLAYDRVENALKKGDLVQIDVADAIDSSDLYIAWKTTNRGKGLQRLRSLFNEHYLQMHR